MYYRLKKVNFNQRIETRFFKHEAKIKKIVFVVFSKVVFRFFALQNRTKGYVIFYTLLIF